MAGLNIPKREQLENGPKFSDLNKARLKAQDKLSDYAERAAVKGADIAFGEDTGDSFLEDLAYGAVPGGSLYQRAKTGTRPGLLDFADLVPGGGTTLKAASLFVPKDLVKLMGRKVASKNFDKTFEKLPQAVQESWISSFGDLSSDKLGRMRKKRIKHGDHSILDNGKLQHYPYIETVFDNLGDDASGLYYGYAHSRHPEQEFTPKIVLDKNLKSISRDDTALHEGFHLMDESIGTSDVLKRIPNVEVPQAAIKPKHISERWLDDVTKKRKYPFSGWYDDLEFQDNTGLLSPIYYKYDKTHPEFQDFYQDPVDWLADDPHGKAYFLQGGKVPNENRVAQEGFAQFGESIPYIKETNFPVYNSFVKVAEKDPRRNKDYSISFDNFVKYLESLDDIE
jgi:hypothetical protein